MDEERMVRIERAPPVRLLAPTRYRSFKSGPDRLVWDDAMREVRDALANGWRVKRVVVDWGNRRPWVGADVERVLRRLLACEDGSELAIMGGTGRRSSTTFMLVKGEA